MKTKIIINIVLFVAMALISMPLIGQDADRGPIVRKSQIDKDSQFNEKVMVGNDTVSMVIPERNYGRFDRGLYNYLYLPKGQWAFGITASYGELVTEDVQVLSYLKNVDFSGKLYSIKPSVAYAFRSNQTLGLRFDYTRGYADLAHLKMDFDDDMNFELNDVSYHSNGYTLGLFYRNYVGLNRQKRFAVFNEVSIDFSESNSEFKRYYDNVLYDTHSTARGVALNFSPGVCVFLQDNVAFNVSFGVFGLKLKKENQVTNGVEEGSRLSSGANFRFNIFNINFGLMVVI